jgi:hypothetical protein
MLKGFSSHLPQLSPPPSVDAPHLLSLTIVSTSNKKESNVHILLNLLLLICTTTTTTNHLFQTVSLSWCVKRWRLLGDFDHCDSTIVLLAILALVF